MTKKISDDERVRKAYAPKGERGQKMVSFRCDNENASYLASIPNKGRLLNELIQKHREENGGT